MFENIKVIKNKHVMCLLGVGHEVRREKVDAFLYKGTPDFPPTLHFPRSQSRTSLRKFS